VSEAAKILGVSVDTARRLADAGKLGKVTVVGGRRQIDSGGLARYIGRSAPPPRPAGSVAQSARNQFPGIVTRVVRDGVVALVEIQAGPHRVISLMTREAADELRLEAGVRAVASVKATNVVIEIP
jgi:molybdopterin-binding protein